MIFQVTHTHRQEVCPGVDPQTGAAMKVWWEALKANPAVTVLGGYVAPMEHVYHLTIEATDLQALTRALGALNTVGGGRTVPVIPLEDAFALGEAGAFRFQ